MKRGSEHIRNEIEQAKRHIDNLHSQLKLAELEEEKFEDFRHDLADVLDSYLGIENDEFSFGVSSLLAQLAIALERRSGVNFVLFNDKEQKKPAGTISFIPDP